MKCIANMFVSGWLGKLTAAYFPCRHICQCAGRMRSSFLGKLFQCNKRPVCHLVRMWCWCRQSFREITWSVLLKAFFPEASQNPIPFPLSLKLSTCFLFFYHMKLILTPCSQSRLITTEDNGSSLDLSYTLKRSPVNPDPLRRSYTRRKWWAKVRLETGVLLSLDWLIPDKDLCLVTWPSRCMEYYSLNRHLDSISSDLNEPVWKGKNIDI